MALVLSIRNILLVILFLWSVRRLRTLGRKPPLAKPESEES
jgi:hypothetical protein